MPHAECASRPRVRFFDAVKDEDLRREQLVSRLQSLNDNPRSRATASRRSTAIRRHEEAATSRGLSCVPASFMSVMAYIIDFVDSVGGSTLSLGNTLSQLRCAYRESGTQWMSRADEAKVAKAIRELQYADCTPRRVRLPLTGAIISIVIRSMDLSRDEELMEATLYALAHDGLFRSGELFSKLRVASLGWSVGKELVAVTLRRSKTHRAGDGVEVLIMDSGEEFCAARLLRRWMDRRSLWGKGDTLLFPGMESTARGYPKTRWISRLRERLDSLGFEARKYSGHSFRAGGATDLFNSGLDLVLVMRFGRWKTASAALRYFKPAGQVAKVVAAAFRRRGRRRRRRSGEGDEYFGAHWESLVKETR